MSPEGNGVLGEDGRGQGGDGNSPATQDHEASGITRLREKMKKDREPAAPHSPQWGTSAIRRGKVSMHRHPGGGDGAMTKHVALSRCEYGLLTTEDPEGEPASAEPQGH